MKIRDIRLLPLRGATPAGGWEADAAFADDANNMHTLVEVITDEGVTGLGSVFTSAELVEGAVASGEALASDFDDRARDFLKTVPEAIAQAAIEDFCALDKEKVNNRYAHSAHHSTQPPPHTRDAHTQRNEETYITAIRCLTLARPEALHDLLWRSFWVY